MCKVEEFDLIIIGAGPIGLACGIEATKAHLKYLIIDKGCLVNSIYNYPTNMTFFSTSEKLEIGNVPFISHGPKPVRSEALEYYRRVAIEWKLNINLFSEITKITKKGKLFVVNTHHHPFLTRNIVVATGFYDLPNTMNVPGEELEKVHHYYKDAHPYFRKKVIVVGAANSGIDAALECYRKGALVTLIVRGDKISDRVKYWVKPDIENRIKEGAIHASFNTEIISISERAVVMDTPQGRVELENDFVIAMTGYVPDFTFLQNLGVALSDPVSKRPLYNTDTMETNISNVYLAGVICGGLNTHQWFIENSRIHAEVIIRAIVNKTNKLVKTDSLL